MGYELGSQRRKSSGGRALELKPLSKQPVERANLRVRGDGTFVGAVLCVATGHSCGCPATESGKVGFTTATSEPVVDEAVAQHMWVEVDSHLESAFLNDSAYPTGG